MKRIRGPEKCGLGADVNNLGVRNCKTHLPQSVSPLISAPAYGQAIPR